MVLKICDAKGGGGGGGGDSYCHNDTKSYYCHL